MSVTEKTHQESASTTSFYDLDLCDELLDALWDMNFNNCTPVQSKCIPPLLEGKDLIGVAQTGTGKTAAYLLPILNSLQTQKHPKDAVNCLIMAPTRELAKQIDQALQGFSYYMNINGVAVYGGNDGVRYEQERKSLSNGADVVIATPGRLMTHIQLGTLDLSRTTHFVLDEADRMLDMGFYDDILKIVAQLPASRQNILFSATMPDKISELARNMMHDPVEIKIAVSQPAEKIQQSVYVCKESDKLSIIKHIFSGDADRTIIFASSKQKVKELHVALVRKKFHVAAMHSDLSQKERDETMLAFKAGRVDILVATDIVARGIDIDDITLVINFDTPREAEDYVHRIGRTARAGRAGRSITLVGEKDQHSLRTIEKLLGKEIPRAALPEGLEAPVVAPSAVNRPKRKCEKKRSGKFNEHAGAKKKSQRRNYSKSKPKKEDLSAANQG